MTMATIRMIQLVDKEVTHLHTMAAECHSNSSSRAAGSRGSREEVRRCISSGEHRYICRHRVCIQAVSHSLYRHAGSLSKHSPLYLI